MGLVEILMLIRTLSETLPRFVTLIDAVETKAGKPLDQMVDSELLILLREETEEFDDLLEEGKRRAREGG